MRTIVSLENSLLFLTTRPSGSPRKVRRLAETEIAFEDRYLAPTFHQDKFQFAYKLLLDIIIIYH
jgi:hypothetical protein